MARKLEIFGKETYPKCVLDVLLVTCVQQASLSLSSGEVF